MSEYTLPISVDPVSLVTTECITVTSAMRKHARWAHSSVAAILGGSGSTKGSDRDMTASPLPSSRNSIASKSDKSQAADGDYVLANRWGLRGKKGKSIQDNPLISAFTRLRSDLKSCRDIRTFDAPALLHPFLQVIRSSSTSAPITSLALVAVTKFLAYDILNRHSPRISVAMQLLSAAITHCRFEASDTVADEVVLLRILKLMEGMLSRPEGELLGDESVCEMMETGLSMCCQNRLSELLRRSAEISMINMCQVIFVRLSAIDIEEVGDDAQNQQRQTEDDTANLKMDPSVDGDTVIPQHPSTMGSDTILPEKEEKERASNDDPNLTANGDTSAASATENEESDAAEVRPYGILSIRELFRVLIDLLDPHNPQHTDTMRVMALRIIDVALEVAGPSVSRHPTLAALAEDDLCRHLFQLVRSENMAILNASLRVAGTLLSTCRSVLKLQQELYLSYLVACLHPRVDIPREPGINPSLYEGVPQAPKLVKPSPSQTSSGRSTPVPVKDRQKLGLEGGSRKPEAREAMVESIGVLARMPGFMVELFVNYDSEVDRADLCEDLVGLLSRNAFPDSATWSTTNVPPLCLDSLLGYIQFIADRLDDEPQYEGYPDPEKLKSQRQRKKVIVRGATKFNEDPKSGIAYLASQGIIENPEDPELVARFLKGTTRISKKILGEFIAKKQNEKLLAAFINLFDFAGKTVVEALRELLGSFRLPGESPLIERIVTFFSEIYMAKAQPEGIADKDALFVLIYGIIMLNTNLYNPNVKNADRMTCVDFARNLRGVNGGKDFDQDELQNIYDSIKQNEIILPDEHENKHAFDFAWREMLMKTPAAGELIMCDTNIYDTEMFAATWRPIVATLSYVFMSASDDAVFSRVVQGFDQCAQIAAKYGLTEALDRIIYCLASISTLATETPPSTTLNTEVQVGKKTVMVSELAVKFGRDFRAQLATVVLFRVLTGNEATVSESWKYVIRILHNLFINALIPPFADNLISSFDITPIPLQPPSQVVERDSRGETGLLSAFTSYLSSYAADDPPEPSDEELDNTLCTIDCIDACRINDMLNNLKSLPQSSLSNLVDALLLELPEENASAVIVVKTERPSSAGPRPASVKSDLTSPGYNPGMLYTLELATALALRDAETIESVGENLAGSLQGIVRDARNVHPLIVSRVLYYLLNLLRLSYDQPFMRVPVILHAISSFDQDILEMSATPVLNSLSRCIAESELLRREIIISPDFWSILQRLRPQNTSAPIVYEILKGIIESTPPAISSDNYEAAVALANDFASAGSIGAAEERRRDANARRSRGAKPEKPTENDTVLRGIHAIDIIYQMTSRTPSLIQQSHLERSEAWAAYWSPIFRSLTMQCTNPCRDIRHQAVSTLQRSLVSLEFASENDDKWTSIFEEVLFPLILRLLKPEVYHSDPIGMSETRVQAATLVCKIFLRYLDQLSNSGGMLDLWLKILDILDRMMNSGQGESLEEAIPESIKNILLVMADSGHLSPPPSTDENKQKIWTETKRRLDRFLPNLFNELFPVSESRKDVSTAPSKENEENGQTSTPSNGSESNEKQEQTSPSPSPADVD
ncbi:guanine nucleotide exchange factor (Gea2), putative [Talaromyces stipitatus ATCC 10500]|uniref:Guanine nucleotide exchange factor (Gea2), putative n=1 Tax=Talaromyces stipitatus (strain ATCC 10500 / CBS 375.48 / QM 6759 / NRRL 1006) TaxID=441959 RepID=B8LY18_TALSN|nr:guanine nucleotide exchange factor (Gea2), putative [Talaromyces stipitatus ATCC 10500]EED23263.1 guanine nucleotide exchange factor (Gea2), putative [Talaromyces stipitatus ATCC 10500]